MIRRGGVSQMLMIHKEIAHETRDKGVELLLRMFVTISRIGGGWIGGESVPYIGLCRSRFVFKDTDTSFGGSNGRILVK